MKDEKKNFFLKLFLFLDNRGVFSFLQDKIYLKIMFRIRMREKLNLRTPKTFNEKLQWLKLYDRQAQYTDMVDKYEVKRYVANKIGDKYIIPTLGIWDKFEEIDFKKLPLTFVLKCTHDSGGIVICQDKRNFDIDAAREKINQCLKINYYKHGREWPYKDVKPRILAEKYMTDYNTLEPNGLIDYKFYCFNGEPLYLYVSDNLNNHDLAHISFLDMNYSRAEFSRTDYPPFKILPKKPVNFEKMKELARKLSLGTRFLRVDFYEIKGKIYFGELTFYPCSGFMPFNPKEWDEKLGQMIKL